MAQSNLTLIYENFADSSALSGGNWVGGSLGLANLKTPYFAEVARSQSANIADTQFKVDLGVYRPVGGIALGPCSITPYAQARIRAYVDQTATQVAYDTGLIPFPGTRVDPALLEWEDPGFWEGVSQDFNDLGKGMLFLHILPQAVTAQVWTIEIVDGANPDGFVDVGRLIMGRVWQPKYNYGYEGNSLDFEALTDMEESRSGTRFYNPRNLRRSFSFSFDYLPDYDTFRDVYRIATRSGIHNQVVVIPAPDDPESFSREAFVGTLAQLPSLRRPAFGQAGTAYKIEETL